MKFKVVVLDFDGVVVESNAIKHSAFSEMFYGYSQYEEIMKYHYSNNHICRQDKFRYILENILKVPFKDSDIMMMAERFSQLTRQKIIECSYVHGAEDFIRCISSKFPLYIASATPADELKIIIKAKSLGKYFKGIYGAPTGKAVMFNAIIKKEKIAPEDLLFIGDSKEDYDIAVNLKIQFIARLNGSNFEGFQAQGFPDLGEIKTFMMSSIKNG